jgi:predicted nucleic acid-binding protein
MTEVLVLPYRGEDEDLVNRYFGLLSTFPQLEWIAPDLQIADLAARLRARHKLRTPDAMQVATAIRANAEAILTNDLAWTRVEGVQVEVLEKFG